MGMRPHLCDYPRLVNIAGYPIPPLKQMIDCLLFEIHSRTFHLKRDLCIQSNRLREASGLHDVVCQNKKSMNNAFCKHPTTEEIKHADFYLMGP